MNRYIIITGLITLAVSLGLISCDLDKTIDIDLPPYESQPVVESYVVPGQKYKLLLTNSSNFFDRFRIGNINESLERLLIQDAEVTIFSIRDTVILENRLFLDGEDGKVYNYFSENRVTSDFNGPFHLRIVLPDDQGDVMGTTSIPAQVTFDSLVLEQEEEGENFRLLTYLTDDTLKDDFYRRMLHQTTLDSIPEQDFLVDDQFSDDGAFVFGTAFDYEPGDTLINTFYHLTPEYFDFLVSVFNSEESNGNPFGQPGVIESNITGSANAIGIFSGYTFARDTTIIPL